MDRRSFLVGAPLLAAASIFAPTTAPIRGKGRRISCVTGDPGERLYAEVRAAGLRPEVYLDGEMQELAITADEAEGMVVRAIKSRDGSLLFNPVTDKCVEEKVFGRVEIRLYPV